MGLGTHAYLKIFLVAIDIFSWFILFLSNPFSDKQVIKCSFSLVICTMSNKTGWCSARPRFCRKYFQLREKRNFPTVVCESKSFQYQAPAVILSLSVGVEVTAIGGGATGVLSEEETNLFSSVKVFC